MEKEFRRKRKKENEIAEAKKEALKQLLKLYNPQLQNSSKKSLGNDVVHQNMH